MINTVISKLILIIIFIFIFIVHLKHINRASDGKIKRTKQIMVKIISFIDNLDVIDSETFSLKQFNDLELKRTANISYFDYLWLIDNKFKLIVITFHLMRRLVILCGVAIFILTNIPFTFNEVNIAGLLIILLYLLISYFITFPYKIKMKSYMKNINGESAVNFIANWIYYILKTNEYVLNEKALETGSVLFSERGIIYSELGLYIINLKRYVTYEKVDSIEFLQVTTNINLKNGSVLKSNYNEKSIYNEHEKLIIQRIKEELAKRLNDNCIYNIDEVVNTLYYSDKKYIKIIRVD